MDKNEKELEKERKNKEKQDGIDKECDANFAAKKSSGSSGSPVDQLKVWLDNKLFLAEAFQNIIKTKPSTIATAY